MRFLLLLVLMVCILSYVRAKQPATWNSWMTAVGMTNLAVSPTASDSSAPASSADSAAPSPAPVRSIPVGGLVKEGDFASGGLNWEGDGGSGPGGKGVEVKLNPSAWTRVYQTFAGDQRTLYSIEVTYRFSPGLAVSQNPSDYAEISKRLQIPGFERYGSIGISPGEFYGTIGDPTSKSITCEVYSPQYGSTAVQDYQHTYAAIPPNGNNTFALAFPPGTGTVTLQTVYVMSR
jgi:hypothetical protein